MRKLFAVACAAAAMIAGSASAATFSYTGWSDFDTFEQSFTATQADTFQWSGGGYAHTHGGDMAFSIDLMVDGNWTTIVSKSLGSSTGVYDYALANFGAITFGEGLVSAVRLTSSPHQNQSFHNFYAESFSLEQVGPMGVPEPATWAMMVGGFGFAGAAMRRRKVALA